MSSPAATRPRGILELRRRLRLPVVAGVIFLVPLLLLFGGVTVGGRSLVPYDVLTSDPAFRPALAAAGIDAPQNGLVADLAYQNVAWKDFLVDAVADGEAPLWNPLTFGGMPFLAGGQASPLYPPTLLFLVLGVDRAFGWNALLTLLIAAGAMMILGRALGLGPFPSLLMGLAWSLGTLFIANTVFPMIQAAMAWTPLVLAGIEAVARGVEEGGPPGVLPRGRATAWLMVVAAATALTALAGHAEILYYAALLAAAFALYRGAGLGRRHGAAPAVRLLAWLAAAGAAGALLGAIQLVPFAELARASWRAGSVPYDQVAGYAFGWRQAITFLLPDFYGNPAHHAVTRLGGRGGINLPAGTWWGGPVGAKNYVEAAAYVGVAPLLVAVIGLLGSRRRSRLFFAGSGALALTFVFGLPTYRLAYLLPGFNQLRTPFRWVFPATLAVVVLAGYGAQALMEGRSLPRAAAWVGRLGLGAGAAGIGLLAGAYAQPASWLRAVETALGRSAAAHGAVLSAFPDVATFGAYLFWQGTHLAVFTLLASLAVVAMTGPRRGRRFGAALLGLVTVADLVIVGRGFNPAVDPALGATRPPVVTWLADAVATRWGRVVGFGEAKVLWPNTLLRFGIPDLRGYDSVVPQWTVDTLGAIEDPSAMLAFNRIGNFVVEESVASPALAALGGRYIVTTDVLDAPGLDLLYDGEVRVYGNRGAMPRAWVVDRIEVLEDPEALRAALGSFEPEATALLTEVPDDDIWRDRPPARAFTPGPTRVTTATRNRLEVDVYAPRAGLLIVNEAYFPGWRAWVTYAAQEEGGTAGRVEKEVPVYRADGMLRGIPVPAGRSTVRLKYFPLSAKVGLYGSFLGGLLLLLAAAYAVWTRFVDVRRGDEARLIALNSIGPMAAALLNKVVDFAFAMLMLRVLGPEDAGKYYTAITIISFADIFTNFGLNLLTTREVARHPDEAPSYLTQTSVLRLGLWVVALPLLGAYVIYRAAAGSPLGTDTVGALAILAVALVPSNMNSALTSIFQGFERMVVPAAVTIASNFLRVTLGAVVLLLGFGFLGLAAVALVVNWATFGILAVLLVREGVRPELVWRPSQLKAMAGVSLPFMLNHLLQTVFFKVDILLLSQLMGNTVVGWYQAAYKWVDALLIIPGYFTMALFPMMSRRGDTDRPSLARAYGRAVRWLLSLALPVSLLTTFLAQDLVRLLGGAEYLPAGAIVLQVMIWFLPLSFANGIAQYVLLALNRQRLVTPSFVVAVTFNVAANLWAIPRYGYIGAAVVTILSELALLVPFTWALRDLGTPPLVVAIWRPAMATSLMGGVLVALTWPGVGTPPLVAAALAAATYAVVLVRLGGITADDRRLLGRLAGGPEGGVDGPSL